MKPVNFYSTSSDFTLKVKTVEKLVAPGKSIPVAQVIRFVNGRFTAHTEEEVEALKKCSAYGLKVFMESQRDTADLASAQRKYEALAPKKAGRPAKPGRKSKADEMAALEAELAS